MYEYVLAHMEDICISEAIYPHWNGHIDGMVWVGYLDKHTCTWS
jgi:hypothetical protein